MFKRLDMIVFLEKNNLSQKQLAKKLKMSEAELSLKINQKRKWEYDDLYHFNKAFGSEQLRTIFFKS